MKKLLHIVPITLTIAVFLSGCAGYDRAILATKTNIGLDVDSTPPTAEVTIARQEIAIQPTFPDTQDKASEKASENNKKDEVDDEKQISLPLLASFGLGGSLLSPNITGYFAGGDAAVSLAGGNEDDSSLCLKNDPGDIRSPIHKLWDKLIKNDDQALKDARQNPRPFYFASDTLFGLKAAWTGSAGPYPDALKIGYNRKEYASAPIFVYDNCSAGKSGKFRVKLPAFLATIDNSSDMKFFDNSRVKHVQFFATGLAAKKFAERPSVRQIAFENMAPDAAALESSEVNDLLFSLIEEAFNKADATKQQNAVKLAVEKGLVSKETQPTQFLDALSKNNKSPSSLISKNYNELRKLLI